MSCNINEVYLEQDISAHVSVLSTLKIDLRFYSQPMMHKLSILLPIALPPNAREKCVTFTNSVAWVVH